MAPRVSPLQRRMCDDMQIAGLRPRTIDAYSHACKLLAEHYGRSPADLSDNEVRDYLLHLMNERKLARSTVNQKFFGIRFLYRTTLQREMAFFDTFKIRGSKKMPFALSHDEVKLLLDQVQKPEYRTAMALAYSCGLRISEVCTLQVDHILSGHMLVLIRAGKGGHDRYVPLPERTLQMLREHYAATRPPKPWVFCNKRRFSHQHPTALGSALRKAKQAAGVNSQTTMHTLRHSYATTLLLNGIDISTVQKWLGHRDIKTTMIYNHVLDQARIDYHEALNRVMGDL